MGHQGVGDEIRSWCHEKIDDRTGIANHNVSDSVAEHKPQ
jgi:hypothetical protein